MSHQNQESINEDNLNLSFGDEEEGEFVRVDQLAVDILSEEEKHQNAHGLNASPSFHCQSLDNGIIGIGIGNESGLQTLETNWKMAALEAKNEMLEGKLKNHELQAKIHALQQENEALKLKDTEGKAKQNAQMAQLSSQQKVEKSNGKLDKIGGIEGDQQKIAGKSPTNAWVISREVLEKAMVELSILNQDVPRVELERNELWQKFHSLTNEMIITKSGRRLSPILKVNLSGLDKKANYCLAMDIVPSDGNQWKFQPNSADWSIVGNTGGQQQTEVQKSLLHIHPDSPASGEHWLSKRASFYFVRVKNNATNGTKHSGLKPMHKYQPRVHLVRCNDIKSMKVDNWTTVIFPETQFIAVTAYQNHKLVDLKVDNNPFGKGVRLMSSATGAE